MPARCPPEPQAPTHVDAGVQRAADVAEQDQAGAASGEEGGFDDIWQLPQEHWPEEVGPSMEQRLRRIQSRLDKLSADHRAAAARDPEPDVPLDTAQSSEPVIALVRERCRCGIHTVSCTVQVVPGMCFYMRNETCPGLFQSVKQPAPAQNTVLHTFSWSCPGSARDVFLHAQRNVPRIVSECQTASASTKHSSSHIFLGAVHVLPDMCFYMRNGTCPGFFSECRTSSAKTKRISSSTEALCKQFWDAGPEFVCYDLRSGLF